MAFTIFKNILIVLLFFQQSIIAGPDQELFLQANLKYESQDFESALKLYDSISKKGSAVWFNMALAAQYLNQPARSLMYLLHARQQATASNYWKIQNQINQILQKNQNFKDTIGEHIGFTVTLFSTIVLQCFAVLIVLILALLIICFSKRRIKYLILGSLLLLLDVILLTQKNNISHKLAVIQENGALLYSGPSKVFTEKLNLAPLSIVSVLQERESWYKVRYGKMIGWLEAQAVII